MSVLTCCVFIGLFSSRLNRNQSKLLPNFCYFQFSVLWGYSSWGYMAPGKWGYSSHSKVRVEALNGRCLFSLAVCSLEIHSQVRSCCSNGLELKYVMTSHKYSHLGTNIWNLKIQISESHQHAIYSRHSKVRVEALNGRCLFSLSVCSLDCSHHVWTEISQSYFRLSVIFNFQFYRHLQ